MELNRRAEESNGLLKLEEDTDAPDTYTQFRNFLERGTQVIKKLVQTMTKMLKEEKLPVLKREEANLLLGIACFETKSSTTQCEFVSEQDKDHLRRIFLFRLAPVC